MKTPWWLAPALLFVAALAQASLLPSLGLSGARPDLVVALVALWACLRGGREAIIWGFTGGLLLDLMSQAPLGTAALALVVVAGLSTVGEASVFRTNFLLPTAIVFWASVIYQVLYLFLLRTHQYPVEWVGTLRHSVVPGALLSAVCAPALYWLLAGIEKRTRVIAPVEW